MILGVGTTSELKLRAISNALSQCNLNFEIVSGKVASVVPEEPIGYEQLTQGAEHRAQSILKTNTSDLGLGIESGIIFIKELDQWFDLPCVCLVTNHSEKYFSFGAAYSVPDWIVSEIKSSKGDYDLMIQKMLGGSEKDAIGIITDGMIKREEIITQAIVCVFTSYIYRERLDKNTYAIKK